jgi:hypothetical protein
MNRRRLTDVVKYAKRIGGTMPMRDIYHNVTETQRDVKDCGSSVFSGEPVFLPRWDPI